MTNWVGVYRDIAVLLLPIEQYAPKPSAVDLDSFDQAFSFRLPHVYREFIQVFGPGVLQVRGGDGLGLDVVFWAPECDEPAYDMTSMNVNTRGLLDKKYQQHLSRLVFFGDNSL